jgi:surfeit locus 1 family protein
MNTIDDLIENQQFRRFFPPLAATLLFVLFVSLGLWQLDRAAEKNRVQALFEEEAPHTRVTGHMPVTEFQRIEAYGQYLGERQVLIDNMFLDGRPGLYAITAFRYAMDQPLLIVNRGWIARPPANAAKPDLSIAGDTRTVRGRVGSLPRVGIRSREAFREGDDWPKTAVYPTLEDLSRELGENLLPFVLLLGPDADDGFVRRWQPQDRGPMMHYGYALQWFAMAAAVAGIFVWRLRKKRI